MREQAEDRPQADGDDAAAASGAVDLVRRSTLQLEPVAGAATFTSRSASND
jgi:hypothetical protein